MDTPDPISLIFGGMEKLGPGDNAATLHVLRLLPKQQFKMVVDAGCGTGRQTLVLARELGTLIHAVDSHPPFLADLERRAELAQLRHLVRTYPMSMKEISRVFSGIDLLWSEGAAYNIGFTTALADWASAVVPGGFVVLSELTWLSDQPPAAVLEFFQIGYPAMQSAAQNVAAAERAGYRLLATHTLPRQAWVEGYYNVLGSRAQSLLKHEDAAVREFAAGTIQEIEVFAASEDSYGYVFYVLERR